MRRTSVSAGGVVGYLVFVEFTSGVLQGYYTPLLSDVARHLSINDADVNWFEAAQLMLSAIVVAVLAKRGDLHGHRRMLLVTAGADDEGGAASSTTPLRVVSGSVYRFVPFDLTKEELTTLHAADERLSVARVEERARRPFRRRPDPRPKGPRTEQLRLPEPEEREAYLVLDFALRAGEVLLSGGAGAADVTASTMALAHACGLQRVEADITFTSITLVYVRTSDVAPVTSLRLVRRRALGHTRVTEVHNRVDDVVEGRLEPAAAMRRLEQVRPARHPYRGWVVTAAQAVLAAAIVVLLGGGPRRSSRRPGRSRPSSSTGPTAGWRRGTFRSSSRTRRAGSSPRLRPWRWSLPTSVCGRAWSSPAASSCCCPG